jgi:hypothetical protein
VVAGFCRAELEDGRAWVAFDVMLLIDTRI